MCQSKCPQTPQHNTQAVHLQKIEDLDKSFTSTDANFGEKLATDESATPPINPNLWAFGSADLMWEFATDANSDSGGATTRFLDRGENLAPYKIRFTSMVDSAPGDPNGRRCMRNAQIGELADGAEEEIYSKETIELPLDHVRPTSRSTGRTGIREGSGHCISHLRCSSRTHEMNHWCTHLLEIQSWTSEYHQASQACAPACVRTWLHRHNQLLQVQLREPVISQCFCIVFLHGSDCHQVFLSLNA
jgi:hypothetical protein